VAGIVFGTGALKLLEIAADFLKKSVALVGDREVCFRSVVVNSGFISVDIRCLPAEQLSVLFVRFGVDVKGNERRIRHRKHIVESEETETASIQFHDMYTGFDIGVVRLRGFHRYEISVTTNEENDANIWTAGVLIMLDALVISSQIAYVFILDPINS